VSIRSAGETAAQESRSICSDREATRHATCLHKFLHVTHTHTQSLSQLAQPEGS